MAAVILDRFSLEEHFVFKKLTNGWPGPDDETLILLFSIHKIVALLYKGLMSANKDNQLQIVSLFKYGL